jgi:hypothetical protein
LSFGHVSGFVDQDLDKRKGREEDNSGGTDPYPYPPKSKTLPTRAKSSRQRELASMIALSRPGFLERQDEDTKGRHLLRRTLDGVEVAAADLAKVHCSDLTIVHGTELEKLVTSSVSPRLTGRAAGSDTKPGVIMF